MAVYYRPAIYSGGAWYHLPPFNLVINPSPIVESHFEAIPHGQNTGISSLYNKRHGWAISVSGMLKESNFGDGLGERQDIEDLLFDSDGYAKTVNIIRYYDDSAARKDAYASCQIDGPINWDGRYFRCAAFSFNLRSLDARRHNPTTLGISAPGSSTWEAYLPNGLTPATAAVPLAQAYSLVFIIPGEAEVTDANNDDRTEKAFTIEGGAVQMAIKGIQIIGSSARTGTTGNTRAVVSDAVWNGAGSTIKATAAYNARGGSRTAGTITVTEGATAYVFLDQANGHHDVMVKVDIESV